MSDTIQIEKPTGKLGVLIPGLGAVATTFIAGVYAIKKGISQPIGSLTQMGTILIPIPYYICVSSKEILIGVFYIAII